MDERKLKYPGSLHNHLDWSNERLRDCIIKTEDLIDYADAKNVELTMSASEAVNVIRNRSDVKMPAFPTGLSNDAFWNKYENERMVELAFEGQRFWDVRRWKKGAEFFKNVDVADFKLDGNGNLILNRVTKTRQWDEKYNLYPIPQSEIQKNGNLKQNPNW